MKTTSITFTTETYTEENIKELKTHNKWEEIQSKVTWRLCDQETDNVTVTTNDMTDEYFINVKYTFER